MADEAHLPSPEDLARRLLDGIQAAVEPRTADLTAEVARLVVSRAALENRLEDLMDRWASERNALIRELAIRAIDGDRRVRAETLLRCIEELNMAIPGSDRDDERVRRR
jgi:hypothetical protein